VRNVISITMSRNDSLIDIPMHEPKRVSSRKRKREGGQKKRHREGERQRMPNDTRNSRLFSISYMQLQL